MSRKHHWHRQSDLFFVALGFFTRIPMPSWVEVDGDKLNQASRYFGLVGLCIGLCCAFVFWLSQLWLPAGVAVLLAMIAGVLLTGGFHEDGLADTADGFGGGWCVADKLSIMKDSRLGTYGALALVLALLLKWQLLVELALYAPMVAVWALVLGHCLSRVLAASIIFTETYVRDDDSSKSRPLAQTQGIDELLILLATGLLLLLCLNGVVAFALLIALWLIRCLLVALFRRQIGGYTGDTLGAAQQLAELGCYLVLLAMGNAL
ncbi:adenosylcobinamide-GDP ribazoletransferase [Shewanella salipaludis]|uniref:Adenosylcobinamide-GDP ribazoletransferase n=1 Tax=Shewanella salipaludis TaxID=2723052 RepID=A0A972FRN3_9GAMM|nr:adenosylcobinamide-GDP ribazoletransferase [Shewanella salipaludis]NMH64923.1 adenosylcobinamide-GDP ribazoletransferase [Shewanella salipaludis]